MFNSKAEFQISIISGGKKTCVVTWPSDKQLADRAHKQKVIRRDIGRGKSKTELPNTSAADAALFAQIAVENAAAFDPEEASAVIDKLDRTDVKSFVDLGDRYTVVMAVPGGLVTHTVKIPKMLDRKEYRRAALSSIDGEKQTEYHASLEPGGILYDKLEAQTEGYAEGSAIPLNHKAAVIAEVNKQIAIAESEDDESDPEA
jgi:hypothetical protein